MQQHIATLIAERLDLCARIDTLDTLIFGTGPGPTAFVNLGPAEQDLLLRQKTEMLALATTMTARLNHAGISLTDQVRYPNDVIDIAMSSAAHSSIRAVLQYFTYSHLPVDKQAVSRPFAELAALLVREVAQNAELTVALRRLLEAKDAAVRASFSKF